jgi:hypothetical protein
MATHSGTALGPLSALVAVWLGASGVHHLMDVLETAHHAPRRAWWKQRLLGAAWVSAALVCTAGVAVGLNRVDFELRARIAHPITGVEDRLVPFATSVVRPHPPVTTRAEPLRRGPTLERSHPPTETPRVRGLDPAAQHRLALRREHRDRLRRALNGLDKRPRPPLEHALVLAILLLLTLAGLSLFYRSAVERPKGTRPRTLPGALVAAASGVLVSWLFGLYVGTLASYAVYYGSLAAVAVLMIWLLLASLALLLGAEVNAQLGANTPSNAANPPARA